MLFNSYSFILFIAVVLVLHYLPFPWKVKKTNLLLASYLFYAVWNPPFILLLWLSTVLDFVAGKKLYMEQNKARRKLLLAVSLLVNLGMLGFFKYGNFLLDNFVTLMSAIGLDFQVAKPNIILPVGISFYTFQTLSYTLDMYKRKSKPVNSLLDFSLFVTFFPQLVAGPIVRPDELVPQFSKPKQANRENFLRGLLLLTTGLFMKVVLADTMLAGSADMVFGASQTLSTADAWLGVLAFSGQIFFDFAGYSTCAIGLAACLGFSLPDNFRFPYAAAGFSDFWRRWHITLSSWLRDYLYIPLGGNRKGSFRTFLNLMITMLLGGLWHGASWTFVAWGALHGIFLGLERVFRKVKPQVIQLPDNAYVARASFFPGFLLNKQVKQILLVMFTFFLVNLTWVFFRAENFGTAWRMFGSLFGISGKGTAVLPTIDIVKVSLVIPLLLVSQWLMRNSSLKETISGNRWWITGIAWGIMLVLIVLSQKSSNSFIYFQF